MEQFKEAIKKDHDDVYCESASQSSSSSSSFYSSGLSSSDMDMVDDASSCGPLYQLADLLDHLPIKRGLSKFYNGKSQTFASLSNLNSDEDLGKNEMCNYGIRRRMKSCKSYGGNLRKFGPKATIKKRSPKILYSPSTFGNKNVLLNYQ